MRVILLSSIQAILTAAIFLISCAGNESTSSQDEVLVISYYYTSESVFDSIVIKDNSMIHKYFDDEKGKCVQWLANIPCWTKEELKTTQKHLSEEQKNELISLIETTDLMSLPAICGGETSGRYYSTKLIVQLGGKRNEIEYRSSISSDPMPVSMEKVRNYILGLSKNY